MECTYTINVLLNLKIGGFESKEDPNSFKEVELTKDVKIKGGYSKLHISSTEGVLTLDHGGIIFQPQAVPDNRETPCNQITNFVEQPYKIKVNGKCIQFNPGMVIIVDDKGKMSVEKIKLESITDVASIRRDFLDYLLRGPTSGNTNNPSNYATTKIRYALNPGEIVDNKQTITLAYPIPIEDFSDWYINNLLVYQSSQQRHTVSLPINANYDIGFSINGGGRRITKFRVPIIADEIPVFNLKVGGTSTNSNNMRQSITFSGPLKGLQPGETFDSWIFISSGGSVNTHSPSKPGEVEPWETSIIIPDIVEIGYRYNTSSKTRVLRTTSAHFPYYTFDSISR
jgi:hypothetical protein